MASNLEPFTLENAEEEIAALRGQVQLMGEILGLSNGPVPNTPAPGTVDLFASGGQINYINASGLQMGLMGAQNAVTQNTTVTQAALTNLVVATQAYKPNDAEAGAVYELECWGHGQQGSSAKQTLQFGIQFGGTAMQNSTFGTTAFSAVNILFRWWAIARVMCITTGVSGTWQSLLLASTADFNGGNIAPGNNNFAFTNSSDSTTTYTVDTTVVHNLNLQAAWGATTGAPTLTSDWSIFKRIA